MPATHTLCSRVTSTQFPERYALCRTPKPPLVLVARPAESHLPGVNLDLLPLGEQLPNVSLTFQAWRGLSGQQPGVLTGLGAGICQMSVDPTEAGSHAITLHSGRGMFFVFSDLCLPDLSD
ncbi:hypothetical protein CB1_000989002 [Camelus ferus]|nr:hypothetical protein CB1_000989002 [Camelus ferus]